MNEIDADLMEEYNAGAQGAWRLAAVEVEALACAACKRAAHEGVPVSDRDRGPKQHTTCGRLLRMARSFRGRAAPSETARGPESVSRGVR